METKGITCRIPLALHQKITEEMRSQGITVGQFIEQTSLYQIKGVIL